MLVSLCYTGVCESRCSFRVCSWYLHLPKHNVCVHQCWSAAVVTVHAVCHRGVVSAIAEPFRCAKHLSCFVSTPFWCTVTVSLLFSLIVLTARFAAEWVPFLMHNQDFLSTTSHYQMGECSAYSSLQADSKVKFAAWPTSWRPPGTDQLWPRGTKVNSRIWLAP